jgi:DNA-directed RNA polymerase specialized sigma24 family protein
MLRALAYILIFFTAVAAHAGNPVERPEEDPAKLTREMAQERLMVYMSAIDADMSPRLQRALDRIPDRSRRLLAMKYYLQRSAEEIEAKFDLDYHFKHVDTIFARVFAR